MDFSVPPHEPGNRDFHGFSTNEYGFQCCAADGDETYPCSEKRVGDAVRVLVKLPRRVEEGQRLPYALNYRIRNAFGRSHGLKVFRWGWANWPMVYRIEVSCPPGNVLLNMDPSPLSTAVRANRVSLTYGFETERDTSAGFALVLRHGLSAAMELSSLSELSIPSLHERDFFLCHASSDKDDVIRPVAGSLQELGFSLWLDEAELELGDLPP